MKAENHAVMWVNTSSLAREALLDSRAGTRGIDMLAEVLMPVLAARFQDAPIPDINGLYLFAEQLDGAVVGVVCKPRGFRTATATVGWAVALLSVGELGLLETATATDRNVLLVRLLDDETPEQAQQWTEAR